MSAAEMYKGIGIVVGYDAKDNAYFYTLQFNDFHYHSDNLKSMSGDEIMYLAHQHVDAYRKAHPEIETNTLSTFRSILRWLKGGK